MYFFSHLSTAVYLNNVMFHGAETAAVSGALLPDLVDKNLAWVLHVTKSSHGIGHSLVGVATATAFVRLAFGARAAETFSRAYFLHLIEDEVHHGRVPWLFPFSSWKRARQRPSKRRRLFFMSLELPSLALLAYSWRFDVLLRGWTTRLKGAAG